MATPPRVCIDRVLPSQLGVPQRTIQPPGGPQRAIGLKRNWPNGLHLRVRFLGGTADERNTAMEEANWWTKHANLTFDFGDDPQAEIRVAFDHNDGAWSYIGTDNRSIPVNQPTMNLGFLDPGTAAHEFGHALGLAHEHQNPAGGIEWNEDVVLHELSGPPNFWTEEQIRFNVLNKYRLDQIVGTEFDRQSIMLYFFPGTWVKSGVGTSANQVLSTLDKSFIASSKGYPGRGGAVEPVEIKVNATDRTKAAIGSAGEQDLFRFTVAATGFHVIDTRGDTDVVMRLFGPDDDGALIGEDDDSGYKANARIGRQLAPGAYLVQIQHYSPTGIGSYSVAVRRP